MRDNQAVKSGFAPTATRLTFLFTDIEGSTRLWASDPGGMSASLRLHDELLRTVIESHGGRVFSTAGDGFNVVFEDASAAVVCAQSAQLALAESDWPGPPLLVRMGLHRGVAEARDGDYFGPVVNTAARVGDAGHGGQIVISEDVHPFVDVETADLGRHRLKGVPEAVQLHQVGAGEFPALRVVLETMSSLPAPVTSFVGRELEIRDIRAQLLEHRMVTVAGPGGSGKTRLAIEIAMREISNREHGAYFADLSVVTDEADVVPTIAAAVRLPLTGGDPTEHVLDYLDDKDALLLIDNCEHVIEACAEFADAMLRRQSEWRMIATSREHFAIEGELVTYVTAMSAEIDGAATELFLDRAASAKPGIALDDDGLKSVAELCARLDGLPLAIELAAARIAVMSPSEMLARVDDRLRLLSGGRSRNRHRLKTLEATLDWSYDLLDDEEQNVFDSLGVMAGPFDVSMVAAVAGIDVIDAVEILESLVAKSLVTSSVGQGHTTFHLLETMRAYATSRLEREGNRLERARDRHLQHHVDSIEATVRAAASWVVWPWETVERWLPLILNLESAIDWALAVGRNDDAAELMIAATPLWREQLTVQHNLERIDAILEAGIDDSDRRERLLIPEIQFALTVNDRARAMPYLSGAVEVENLVAREFRLLMGANSTSMTDPERSLALAEEASVFGSDAFTFWDKNRADIHLFAGEYGEAARVLGAQAGENLWAVIDGTIAIAHLMDGNPAQALKVAKDHPMRHSIRMSFGLIVGLCHLALGESDAGRQELLAEARTASLGRMDLIANSGLVGLAALAHHEGDTALAAEIILNARCQREIAVNALARMVADQIGVLEAFIEQQVDAFGSGDTAGNDRTALLRTMLGRF
ncbi:MAG: adenylate/guanylate cyclase domain-containing protein [Actinomycetota bacterium]